MRSVCRILRRVVEEERLPPAEVLAMAAACGAVGTSASSESLPGQVADLLGIPPKFEALLKSRPRPRSQSATESPAQTLGASPTLGANLELQVPGAAEAPLVSVQWLSSALSKCVFADCRVAGKIRLVPKDNGQAHGAAKQNPKPKP